MFYYTEQTTSTNDLAKADGEHGDLFSAERQSAGRGQRGNKWHSGEGLNITFSVVLEPALLEATHQFFISMIAALAIVDTLKEEGIEAQVKWTNDIYIGDKKIAGILIENSLRGSLVARSIVGIGLNINQMEFDPTLPNPTSMALTSGLLFTRVEIMGRVHARLMELYAMIGGNRKEIFERYTSLLYRRGEWHQYKLANGTIFDGMIEAVEPTGALIISNKEGEKRAFQFKEVEFLI